MGRSPLPLLVAGAIGIFSGVYIWKEPLEQYKANTTGIARPADLPSDASNQDTKPDTKPDSTCTAATPPSPPAPTKA